MLINLVVILVITWLTYKHIKIVKAINDMVNTMEGSITVIEWTNNFIKEQINITNNINTQLNDIAPRLDNIAGQQNTQQNEIFQELRIIAKQLNSIDRKYIEISQEQNTIARQLNMMVNNDKN